MAKIKTLRRCSIFRSLAYRDLAILAPKIREETAKAQAWLAEEGKPTRGLIVVKSGRVKLFLPQAKSAFVQIGPGDFFGELSLADGDQTRGVAAQAVEECEYLRMDPRDFHALSTQDPGVAGKVAQGILTAVAEKMARTRELLKDLIQRETGR